MSEESILLLDQIDRLISTYQWTVGIFITIILGAVAFFSYVQWKIKKEQEEKIKEEIIESLSKDISELLEPLITTSLNQIRTIGFPDYVSNIKTFESYLMLDNKYNFTDNVSKHIRGWKYVIVSNFKTRIEELLSYNKVKDEHKQFKNYHRLFIDEKNKQLLMPNPHKLREATESLAKDGNDFEKLSRILDDYEVFYSKYKDL